jgi:hypothetical protein
MGGVGGWGAGGGDPDIPTPPIPLKDERELRKAKNKGVPWAILESRLSQLRGVGYEAVVQGIIFLDFAVPPERFEYWPHPLRQDFPGSVPMPG